MSGHSAYLREESRLATDQRLLTIDILSDNVLVEIFDFCMDGWPWYPPRNTWHPLVHVCRRWRYLVFASPRRLNLRLEYEGHAPMSTVLGAWPVLPVLLKLGYGEYDHPKSDQRWNNRVVALESEDYNRIREIDIASIIITSSRWKRFAAAMQKPFPELTRLRISVEYEAPVLPDSFMGGSAPRLRELNLTGVPFPSMPRLLLSANGLVKLSLYRIPEPGYISPDAMATALTAMTRLEVLILRFRSPRYHPDQASQPLPPPARFVLPALTKLTFEGVHEYLEDLLARIDAPLLYDLCIVYFTSPNFDVPQLHRLLDHAEAFKTYDYAGVSILKDTIQLSLYPKTRVINHHTFELYIKDSGSNWQLSSLAQICSPSFSLISALEELQIRESDYLLPSHWKDDMEDAQWLELLDPFTALKDLYLTHGIAQSVCGALQELSGERAIEVLPALRNLFVDGSRSLEHIQEAIRPFIAARRLSSHPVTIIHWRTGSKFTEEFHSSLFSHSNLLSS